MVLLPAPAGPSMATMIVPLGRNRAVAESCFRGSSLQAHPRFFVSWLGPRGKAVALAVARLGPSGQRRLAAAVLAMACRIGPLEVGWPVRAWLPLLWPLRLQAAGLAPRVRSAALPLPGRCCRCRRSALAARLGAEACCRRACEFQCSIRLRSAFSFRSTLDGPLELQRWPFVGRVAPLPDRGSRWMSIELCALPQRGSRSSELPAAGRAPAGLDEQMLSGASAAGAADRSGYSADDWAGLAVTGVPPPAG
jgi:hypothetical protein